MKHKIVSIIIPAYNIQNYIERCINSVINQTYKELDIIIVNDGSCDETYKIVEFYSTIDTRIKFINQNNRGLSAARNVGIANALGEYLLFVDGDDEIMPNTVEKCLSCFTDDVDSVWFGTEVLCEHDPKTQVITNEYMNRGPEGKVLIEDKLMIGLNVCACTKMFRTKNFIKYNIKFPEGRLNEDEPTHYNYYSIFRNAYMLKDKLYIYHIRKHSIMDKIRKKTEGCGVHMIFNLEYVYEFWTKHNLLKDREKFFEKICEKFIKSGFYRSLGYERPFCLSEAIKLLRKWNIDYSNPYLINLRDGKFTISIE